MLKRDRTSEEKHVDAIMKTAILRLGPNPPAEETPTPYPYTFAWDRDGRKGQRCAILKTTTRTALIRFADGFETVVNRMAVRRYEQGGNMDKAAEKILSGKGSKLSTHGIHIKRTDNQKYLVTHDLRDKNGNPPTDGQRPEATHTADSAQELATHIAQHMPLQDPDEQQEPPQPSQ